MKVFAVAALAGVSVAAPFSFPLTNGFPNPSPAAIIEIQKQAGGTLPNTPLPTGLAPAVLTSLQLVAANELFEVAFFTQLYQNITMNVDGYNCTEEDRTHVLRAIYRIRAQEELHALGANAILAANNAQTVGPCRYVFPVDNFASAIKLANTFTDVVLGVLPQVQLQGATTGATGLIPLFGSILGQEAEQVGWFRTLQKKLPSAAPFLTGTTPEFALSAVKMFLVPGSCPAEYSAVEAAVKSFPPLAVSTAPSKIRQSVTFSISGDLPFGAAIAYISGQNSPVVVDVYNIAKNGALTTFDAGFPAEMAGFANGLTVAAVVSQNRQYADPRDVARSTLYGPGLIEYL